jgi:hypothetical protein
MQEHTLHLDIDELEIACVCFTGSDEVCNLCFDNMDSGPVLGSAYVDVLDNV